MSQTQGIQLSARGTAVAPYDLVHFKITISDVDTTGARAKIGIHDATLEVTKYVDSLIREGSAFNKVLNLSIDPVEEYDQSTRSNHLTGYRASLQVTFSTTKVGMAMDIQEKLTGFPKSKVDSLVFGFNNVNSLREKALESAWVVLKDRFFFSKKLLLGIATLDYEVVDWSIDYEDTRVFSKVAAPTEEEAGSAKVSVHLTVTWQRKSIS
jgi:uncharacterized protein YggE